MKRATRFLVSAAVPIAVVIGLALHGWYQERLWRPGLEKPPAGELWRALVANAPIVVVVVLLLTAGTIQTRRDVRRKIDGG